jgi:hypothetical protein
MYEFVQCKFMYEVVLIYDQQTKQKKLPSPKNGIPHSNLTIYPACYVTVREGM